MAGNDAEHGSARPVFRVVWAAAVAAVVATYAIQAHTFTAVKTAVLAARSAQPAAGARDVLPGALDALSWTVLVVLAGAAVTLALRWRDVRCILRSALSELGPRAVLLLVIVFLAVRSYTDAGVPHHFDAKQHYAKVAAVSDLLGDGIWPRWTWRWYGGFPLLRFYGPGVYLGAGGLGALLGSPSVGLKTLLVAVHAASGWAAYAWVRTWSGSRGAATVATVAYLLVPQRYHTLLLLGRLPEAALYLLFPLLLLTVERFTARRSPRAAVATGVVLAAMLLSHPMMGLLGGSLGAVYALLRLTRGGVPARTLATVVAYGGAAGALAAGLAAFWLVPAMTERRHVVLEQMYGAGPGAVVPGVPGLRNLVKLFTWDPSWSARGSVGYAGLTLLALAAYGLVRGWRNDRSRTVPLLVTLLLALVYTGGSYFQARAVAFVTLLLCAAAASAVAAQRGTGRAVVVLLLILVDLLPFSVKSPFRPGLEGVQNDLAALAERVAAGKVVVASIRTGDVQVSQWTGWDESRLYVLGGPFREGASALYPWQMALLARVQADLQDGGPLEPATVHGLRLHGVAAIVVDDGTGLAPLGVLPGPGYRVATDPHAVYVEDAWPALFGLRAEPPAVGTPDSVHERPAIFEIPGPATPWALAFDRLTALHEIRADAPFAARLVLAAGVDATPAGTDRWPPPRITDVQADHTRVAFAVTAAGGGNLLLPFADYPGVTVRVDGAAAAHVRSIQGACIVPIDAGTHRVELLAPTTPESAWGRWVSLVTLLLALGVWFAPLRTQP